MTHYLRPLLKTLCPGFSLYGTLEAFLSNIVLFEIELKHGPLSNCISILSLVLEVFPFSLDAHVFASDNKELDIDKASFLMLMSQSCAHLVDQSPDAHILKVCLQLRKWMTCSPLYHTNTRVPPALFQHRPVAQSTEPLCWRSGLGYGERPGLHILLPQMTSQSNPLPDPVVSSFLSLPASFILLDIFAHLSHVGPPCRSNINPIPEAAGVPHILSFLLIPLSMCSSLCSPSPLLTLPPPLSLFFCRLHLLLLTVPG